MERHPYFTLWLHTDAELNQHLPAPVVERVTLHEWPLSCVQRLTLADQTLRIYKTQFLEGVEAAFYARARSPLLTNACSLGTYQTSALMLLDYIDAPRFDTLTMSERDVIDQGSRLSEAIRRIAGHPPVYMDLSSAGKWLRFARETLSRLDGLIRSGQYQQISSPMVHRLARWAESAAVIDQVVSAPGLIHADLTGSNIFVTSAGFKVIDWQYPRLAPAGCDLACLLEASGYDPLKTVHPAVVQIGWFIRLAWFVTCQVRLFPAGDTYEASIEDLMRRILTK